MPKRWNETAVIDDENPEWTADDFRRARPAAEVLPPELAAILPKRKPGQRGPQRSPVKKRISLRLDEDILARYKATGPGWQTRINEDLKKLAARRKEKAA